MVGQVTRRLVLGGALLAIAGAPFAAPGTALAAGPDAVSISGTGTSEPIVIRADKAPEVFAAVYSQVSWLAKRPGHHVTAPPSDRLGPKYTVVVLVSDKPNQRYELYPMATGGPRAFRPAAQPNGRTTAAWFYGRLNMAEALRAAGAALPNQPDGSGGIGGGGGQTSGQTDFTPVEDVSRLLALWRHVLLLNGAVVLTITLGLAGISLLVRRRV